MKIREKLLKRKLELRLLVKSNHTDQLCQKINNFIDNEQLSNISKAGNSKIINHNNPRKWLFMKNNFNFAITAIHLNNKKNIVNNVTLFPSESWDGEDKKLSGQLADTFTNKNYQGLGLFDEAVIAAIKKSGEKKHNIVYGFPNQYSLPGYINRMNFKIVDDGLITYISRLSSLHILLKLIPKISCNKLLLFKKIDPIKLKISLHLYFQKIDKCIAFEESLNIGREFDELWSSCNKDIRSLNVRDSKFIKWRYLKNQSNFKIYKIIYQGVFSGYISTLEKYNNEKKALKDLWLVDWFYGVKNKILFEKEIIKFLKTLAVSCEADNIIIQQSQHSPLSIGDGFKCIDGKRNLVIYQNDEGAKFLNKSNPWHFTLGDTDHF